MSTQYILRERTQRKYLVNVSASQLACFYAILCKQETVQISSESILGYYLPLHDRHRAAVAILIQLHPEGWGRVDDVVSQAGDREVVDHEGDLRTNQRSVFRSRDQY